MKERVHGKREWVIEEQELMGSRAQVLDWSEEKGAGG